MVYTFDLEKNNNLINLHKSSSFLTKKTFFTHNNPNKVVLGGKVWENLIGMNSDR